MIGKRTVDRALTILAAAAAPLLSILTRHHVIAPADAVDIGTTVAAIIAAYHSGALVERKLGTGPTARGQRPSVATPPDLHPAGAPLAVEGQR